MCVLRSLSITIDICGWSGRTQIFEALFLDCFESGASHNLRWKLEVPSDCEVNTIPEEFNLPYD